jgi:hypothetical protein
MFCQMNAVLHMRNQLSCGMHDTMNNITLPESKRFKAHHDAFRQKSLKAFINISVAVMPKRWRSRIPGKVNKINAFGRDIWIAI